MMEGKKAEFPSIKLFNNPGWIDQKLDPETVTPVFHVDHKEYLEEEQKLFFHYEQHINNVSHIIFSNNHLLCKYYNRIFSEDDIYITVNLLLVSIFVLIFDILFKACDSVKIPNTEAGRYLYCGTCVDPNTAEIWSDFCMTHIVYDIIYKELQKVTFRKIKRIESIVNPEIVESSILALKLYLTEGQVTGGFKRLPDVGVSNMKL